MTGHDEGERYEEIEAKVTAHGFNRVLGLELDAVGDDWARIRVPHEERFVNPDTEAVMHGGVVAASLDVAQAYATVAAIHDDPRTIGPTINLDVDFVSTADEPLLVTGEILRVGKCNSIVQGRAEGADTGELVATGQGVWRVFATDR